MTRLHAGWYFAIFFVVGGLLVGLAAAVLPDISPENLGYAGSAVAFVITYAIYARVERGARDLLGGVYKLLWLVLIVAAMGLPVLPLYLIVRWRGVGLSGATIEVLTTYAVIVLVAAALVTFLSSVDKKKPSEVFQKLGAPFA